MCCATMRKLGLAPNLGDVPKVHTSGFDFSSPRHNISSATDSPSRSIFGG